MTRSSDEIPYFHLLPYFQFFFFWKWLLFLLSFVFLLMLPPPQTPPRLPFAPGPVFTGWPRGANRRREPV